MPIKMTTFIIISVIFSTIFFALWTYIKSSSWVATNGTIENIEIIEKYNQPDLAISENRKSFDYIINLKYIYTVDNSKYTGTKIYPGLPNIFSNKKDAEAALIKYPESSKVTVYYDPSSPQNSSLKTSKSISVKSLAILVIFILFVSLVVFGGIIIFQKL